MRFAKPIFFCVAWLVLAVDARAVVIQWSAVGNPGNSNDPADGDSFTTGIQNFGAVPYNYNIGTNFVTASQYVEFLNAADPTAANTAYLYDPSMGDARYGGVTQGAGAPNGSKYSVIPGNGNHPMNYVSWYGAIRFANWMNNGQGSGDTETGAYTLLHDGSPTPTPIPSNADSITRNAGATIFLPSENEWYKAAYFNPSTSSYFKYPTSSNTIPIASGPTGLANHANYSNAVGNLTNVGAYSGTTSPYGAFDMGGNLYQWNEVLLYGSFRGIRSCSFDVVPDLLQSSFRYQINPAVNSLAVGFRLASVAGVPEPSTLALAAFGFIGLAAWRWRRKRA